MRICKDEKDPELVALIASGVAQFRKLIAPQLVPRENSKIPADGIFELDFVMGETNAEPFEVEVEVEIEVVFKIKNAPGWIKGFKINAAENSDIELL